MFHIHVLRIKCERQRQGDMFRNTGEPVSIITQSFQAKPTADVGRGSNWHIGNVDLVDGGGIAFAMGRTQAVKSPQFDSVTHDFLEEDALRAPFTLGVFDLETQACGVIRKANVSQSANEIASKLERLLNAAPFAAQSNSVIVVEPIPDSVRFLDAIRRSRAVIRFGFTVSAPNPQDPNRLIQGPAKEFTQEVRGDKTKIETSGDDLDKEVIEDVTNAVASDGEQAFATVRPGEGGPPKRINLSGNPVAEQVDPDGSTSVFAAILNATKQSYKRIRGQVK